MDQTTDPAGTENSELARQNLQVIRDLMERATVYRAISAVPALVGGALALAVGLMFYFLGDTMGKTTFVLSWLGVLLFVDALNTWLFYKDCKERRAEFPSPQMMHGLLAMGPPMIILGVIGLVFAWVHGEFVRCVYFWVIGYGLGLLATSSFAPRSIKRLGWNFLCAGLLIFILAEFTGLELMEDSVGRGSMFMGATFGLGHLVYGFITLRETRREASADD